jgi:hypothetical protein
MSYDLAVWAGPRPAGGAEAAGEYVRRLEEAEEAPARPTPPIAAFLEDLLARSPMDSPGCPWAGPPLDEATGDMAVLTMTSAGAQRGRDLCTRVAASHGLLCFDPQTGRLLERGSPTRQGRKSCVSGAATTIVLRDRPTSAISQRISHRGAW